ncbi:transposable element Tcb2 transposase [Trichonephila clavipes]|nr:transposable element Tcb2 transposase [Trichonephila clavipes]
MLLRRIRGQYEQQSQFERGRIIGMMEAGWSASGATHEETELQRNGTRLTLAKNPDYNLSSDDNCVRLWRRRGERLNPAFALLRHTASTAGVTVWVGITYNTRSSLVLIRGTITAQWYVHDILQPHVLPLMHQLPGAILQPDNDWPHTAKLSQDCLPTVTTLPWPARSPDHLQ